MVRLAHTEVLAVAELKGCRCDKVLDGKPGWSKPIPREVEILLLVHVEHAVHQRKAFLAIHRRCGYAQPLEVVQDIRFDTVQTRLYRFDMGSFHAESQILGFDQAVVATGKLIAEHLCIFLSNIVEIIALGRNDNPRSCSRSRMAPVKMHLLRMPHSLA